MFHLKWMRTKKKIPQDFSRENQRDANFHISLQKYVIPAPLYSRTYQSPSLSCNPLLYLFWIPFPPLHGKKMIQYPDQSQYRCFYTTCKGFFFLTSPAFHLILQQKSGNVIAANAKLTPCCDSLSALSLLLFLLIFCTTPKSFSAGDAERDIDQRTLRLVIYLL